MRTIYDRARSAAFKCFGVQSVTIESRTLGALKFSSGAEKNIKIRMSPFEFKTLNFMCKYLQI